MVKRRYSARAKKGTRDGINLRIRFIKDNIAGIEAENRKFAKYLGRGLNDKFIRRVIRTNKHKIAIRKRQLRRYEARRADYKKRGLI